jgi:low affinity Fe/Cu permease
LVIQRAEYRDTEALQAKLDELLRVNHDARNEPTKVDQKEPEEIEKQRKRDAKA